MWGQRLGPFTLSLAPCHAPVALGCSLRAAHITAWSGAAWGLLTQCGDQGGGGRGAHQASPRPRPQGVPGKDGRDGVPGLDGEKVGVGPVACGAGVCGSSASWASAACPRSPAGRGRSQWCPRREGSQRAAGESTGFLRCSWGGGPLPWVPERGLVRGNLPSLGCSAAGSAALTSDPCRASPDEQGPRARRENWYVTSLSWWVGGAAPGRDGRAGGH